MCNIQHTRNRITRRLLLVPVLMGSTLLVGCGPLSDLLLDCIDDDGPILRPTAIPDPVLNESYDVTITASIENEPFDNSFDYDIVVSRTLPPGLVADIFERQVRISGAATELGAFSIDVGVSVNDPGFNSITINNSNNNNNNLSNNGVTSSNLCRFTTQRTYTVSVQQDS